jgi:hypothetical protein
MVERTTVLGSIGRCLGRFYPWIGTKCASRAHFVSSACSVLLKISKMKKREGRAQASTRTRESAMSRDVEDFTFYQSNRRMLVDLPWREPGGVASDGAI